MYKRVKNFAVSQIFTTFAPGKGRETLLGGALNARGEGYPPRAVYGNGRNRHFLMGEILMEKNMQDFLMTIEIIPIFLLM